MPTNEERRDVARKLRECRGGWSSGECYYTITRAIGLPDTSREDGGHALYSAIADLIEPEPERTCHRVWHSGTVRSDRAKCSECGYGITDRRFVYCPKCGAKIEEDS